MTSWLRYIVAICSGLFAGIPVTYARISPKVPPSNLPETGDFGFLFTTVINFFLGLVGLIAVLMLFIGGVHYLISNGNEQGIEKAKHTIFYAIIGIIVTFLSYAIAYTVTSSLQAIEGGEASPQQTEQ